MNPIVPRFKDLGIFGHTPHQQPNHVLINEYKPGEGIMPHEDGKAYASVVATVSLGGTVCLSLTQKLGSKEEDSEVKHVEGTWKVPTRILQEPRSLLITTGDAYESLLHGVDGVEADEGLNAETVANWGLLHDRTQYEKADGRNVRTTRVSLTYRDVLKVSSAASKVFGGLGRR
jgi:alkylated DNA repair protein alkB family protein 6